MKSLMHWLTQCIRDCTRQLKCRKSHGRQYLLAATNVSVTEGLCNASTCLQQQWHLYRSFQAHFRETSSPDLLEVIV